MLLWAHRLSLGSGGEGAAPSDWRLRPRCRDEKLREDGWEIEPPGARELERECGCEWGSRRVSREAWVKL